MTAELRERLDSYREHLPVAAHHLGLSSAAVWSTRSLTDLLRAAADATTVERWRAKIHAAELVRAANDYLLEIGVLKPKV